MHECTQPEDEKIVDLEDAFGFSVSDQSSRCVKRH